MIKELPLTEIVANPFQSRGAVDADAVRSLAEEMAAEGVWTGTLQGRRTKNGKVELVFGHRRLAAMRRLKIPSIKIELVDLTDAQMALRSLEENLQREGLTDLEKADAVKQAIELAVAERRAAGKPERGVIQEVADRLGLNQKWVSELNAISRSMDLKDRRVIEAGQLTAKTALAAKKFGGDDYLRTLATQGKAAKTDGSVAKPTHMTVAAMQKAVEEAPEPVRETLKKQVIAGEVSTPADAVRKARQLAAAKVRRTKEPPPDLREVIVGWTHRLTDWELQMREVVPYMAYVEEVPAVAERFRKALARMIETAQKLL